MGHSKAMSEKTMVEKITIWIGSQSSVVLHTVIFAAAFFAAARGAVSWDTMLLVLTTIVSLEAIYLSIFIQMSVNRQADELAEVSEDVEDIQEDIEEISQDVDAIQKDVDEIQEDVDEIQEDVEDITEDEEQEDADAKRQTDAVEQLTQDVRRLLADLEDLKLRLPK
jgi:peptidoglycan hydrolase CwlO-like protein